MLANLARQWGLQREVCCPHCWHRFSPEKTLWISSSPMLRDDPRLGPEKQQRFLPTRFTAQGDALDGRNMVCHELACPNCHLLVPRAFMEMAPLFMSIIGAPGSGKSVFLGAMTGVLREILVRDFCVSFSDADPDMNSKVIEYENALYKLTSDGDGDQLVPLGKVIGKTVEGADIDTVQFDSGEISYPRPFVFGVQPMRGHPNEKGTNFARAVCLYDNAGESFLKGTDASMQPYTRHLAEAQVLMVVIDPTQDVDFRKAMRDAHAKGQDVKLGVCEFMHRQDEYLQEAARRIRRFARMRETERFQAPVIVVLTKCDAWWPILEVDRPVEPWKPTKRPPFHMLDGASIDAISTKCRQRFQKIMPRITGALDGFAEDVTFVPVTAAGWETGLKMDAENRERPAVRPGAEVQRHWVGVPFLYALRRLAPGVVAELKS